MTQAEALDILKTGANVYLTGEPGSGKSYTIGTFVAYLREHGIEPAITASTGIAATHIHGMTIHSWSRIGVKKVLSDYDLDTIASNEYVSRRVGKTKVLIIDEVSMLDGKTLDLVDRVCQEVKRSSQPFGGIQTVLVGDFFQLPPVSKDGQQSDFAFKSQAWQTLRPLVCYLHEQHRQEDEKFLGFLSALRSNTLTEEHHDYLTSRIYHYDDIPEEVPKLFPHNANVDRLNDEALSHLTTDSHIYEMESEGHPALTAAIMRSCLSPEKLTLKVGAAVMFTKNNPNLGFANGTLGVVTGFDMYSSYPIVETRDGQTIVAEPMEWAVEENGKVRARIVQVPLRLAWAMTIHKSQGMSLDAAVMDLSGSFEFGQGYVALSRVRTLKGLYMLGWNEQALKVHPEILEQDAGFKAQSDEAGALFKKLPATELEKMQNNFIIASGGTLIKKKRVPQTKFKKQKIDTRRVSLELFRAGKTVEEIAEERGMTTSTVFNHLEKLLELKVFQKEEVLKLLPKKIVSHVAQIQQAFIDLNTYKLTPVREHFKDRFSFDELHLVRMTMERLPEQEDK